MSNVFFYEPFYDIDRFVEQAFSPVFQNQAGGNNRQLQRGGNGNVDGAVRSFKPRMDLHEDKEKNLVTAVFEFPGVTKDNIDINVQNGRLTVSAETKQSADHDENGYAVRERRFGKYSRTLQLPQGVKDEEIKASMENGLLTVTFPKSAPELAPKKITIS
ncbi:small heat shock protein [Agrocybe pediades]|nr:small heat shock protein [Agrocybe pediades]